jgi:outer membrane protein
MTPRLAVLTVLVALAAPATTGAQAPLPLADAVSRALSQNLDARSSAAAERQAARRVAQARAGFLPSVDASQTWQRGNQPVFVFGSLLAQRRFAASNFAIDALNHPDAVSNLRTALTIDQAVFDRSTRAGVLSATLSHRIAILDRSRLDQELTVAVSAAYGIVLSAEAARMAATAAVETAAADLELARNRRDVGAVTEADVLQLEA